MNRNRSSWKKTDLLHLMILKRDFIFEFNDRTIIYFAVVGFLALVWVAGGIRNWLDK